MIGKTISYHKISENLGEGGMEIVRRADDARSDRTVAALEYPHLRMIHGVL
jgi:hypothetical protein